MDIRETWNITVGMPERDQRPNLDGKEIADGWAFGCNARRHSGGRLWSADEIQDSSVDVCSLVEPVVDKGEG